MIFIQYNNFGCIYTIDDETKELYYAPIYEDDTVNLSELVPVDLYHLDEDITQEVLQIQQQLIRLNQFI